MFKKFSFKAPEEGMNILILGAVHGNEISGTLAQQEVIEELNRGLYTLKKGSVTFIPCVNEEAQKKDARGVDENLNRVIKYHKDPQTHEEKIANLLIKEIKNVDVLLDLHSTHEKEDKPFAFIDHPTEENLDFLNIIPVQTALAGWPDIYKDQTDIENNCTEEYAFLNGIRALTVECGYHKSIEAIQIAKQSILNTLYHFGILNGTPAIKIKKEIIRLHSFIIKEKEGVLQKEYVHMDPIKKGEIIAKYHDGETVLAPFDGVIIMPNKDANIQAEWFYIGEKS